MALLLNGSGATSADPILSGLGFEWVVAVSTLDATTITGPWIDTANTFPGTNAVTTTPANTNVYHGNDLATDTTGLFTSTSAHGLVVGDYIYLSHASITAGVYKLATVPTTTTFTLVTAPSSAARTGIAFEVAWRYQATAGTAPVIAGAAGSAALNYYKVTAADAAGNAVNQVDSNYVSQPPSMAGTTYLSVDGKAADGSATTRQAAPSFNLLSGWANRGGVSTVAFTTSSVAGHTAAQDFRHSDTTLTDKAIATAIANGLSLTSGDGMKYGAIQLKSIAAAAVIVTQNMQILVDTLAPTVTFSLAGR